MVFAPNRELVPLPASIQAELRRLIRAAAGSVEGTARELRLPAGTVSAGAAGVRLREPTRRRILSALQLAKASKSRTSMRPVAPPQDLAFPVGKLAALAAVRIRSLGLQVAARELQVEAEALLAASIGDPVPRAVLSTLERRLLHAQANDDSGCP